MTKIRRKCSEGLCPSAAMRMTGFSLVELLVALAIFMVIGGAAVKLVQSHVPLVSNQQNQAGMNLNLQNAIAQMQVDVVNAGAGYYNGASVADWPIGITILNCGNPNTTSVSTNGCNSMTGSADCFNAATFTYGTNCFDTLNILAMDTNTPAAHPTDSTGSTTGCADTTLTDLYLTPPTGVTPAALAAKYNSGDQVLLLNINTNGNELAAGNSLANGNKMTTVVLTSNGSVSGSLVHLQHYQTTGNGSYSPTGPPEDPLYISAVGSSTTGLQDASSLTNSFCAQTDWVLRLAPITYTVDTTTNPASPTLTRNGVAVANQVIGFKVGAMTWNTSTTTDQTSYLFNAPATYPGPNCTSNCGYEDNWPLIRSVMVSLIGRTPPNPSGSFRNNFDGGPYQVQALSAVINPRNLSMHDQ